MKPLDILKKRVNETKEKHMRATVETEQLKKTEAALYAEASEIAGRELTTPEEVAKVRDEKADEVRSIMGNMAKELHDIGQLSEQDVEILKREGYLQ